MSSSFSGFDWSLHFKWEQIPIEQKMSRTDPTQSIRYISLNTFTEPWPVWQGGYGDCLAEDKMPQCSLGNDKLFMLFSEYIEVCTLSVRVLLSEYCKNSNYLLLCVPSLLCFCVLPSSTLWIPQRLLWGFLNTSIFQMEAEEWSR